MTKISLSDTLNLLNDSYLTESFNPAAPENGERKGQTELPLWANTLLLRAGYAVTRTAYGRKASEEAKPIQRCVPAPLRER